MTTPWHVYNCEQTREVWVRHLSNLLGLISTAFIPSQWIYTGERNGMLPGMRKPEDQRDAEVQNSRTVWTVIEELSERDPTGVAAQGEDPQQSLAVPLPMAGDVPTAMTTPVAGPGGPAWQQMLAELRKRKVLRPVGSIQSVAERGLQDPIR